MGACTICGANAGFLRNVHRECEDNQAQSRNRMAQAAAQAALGRVPLDQLPAQLNNLAQQGRLAPPAVDSALTFGLHKALEQSLEDHLLTAAEEQTLNNYINRFQLGPLAARNGWSQKIQQAVLLREITEGRFPVLDRDSLPFLFQKSENPVWHFPNVDYAERRTRTERRGTSHGVSIRLAKGLYYSPRTFRSAPVEYQETVHVDNGDLCFTDKHLYFRGSEKSFRIPYSKLVSIDGYSNGISIVRDLASARPQYFLNEDPWFAVNLLNALARR